MARILDVSMDWLMGYGNEKDSANMDYKKRALEAEKKLEAMQKGMKTLTDSLSGLTKAVSSLSQITLS